MENKLELSLLGNLEIRQRGALLTGFSSKKAQALLCFLAVSSQSQPRSILAGLLWGGFPEDKARMNLSQALSTLRQFFPELLDIGRHTVSIQKDALIWLDVAVFETAVKNSSVNLNIPVLQEAIQLYRGDFLNGFSVRNAPEFEEWVQTEQVRLQEMALNTLDTLVNHLEQNGLYEQAADYTRQILVIEPWQEAAHRQLMRLLALCGRRSAALKQYELCRRILHDELGVEPGTETSSLYHKIREGKVGTADSQLEIIGEAKIENGDPQLINAGFSGHPKFPTNLPPNLAPFVGRGDELAALDHLILEEDARLVTLSGPGGIGKTHLALEYGKRKLPIKNQNPWEIRDQTDHPFPDGIFFVPLYSLQSINLILPAIADAIRYQPDRHGSQLLEFLRWKRLLIIIDNFEHLLDGVGILVKILQSTKDVVLLVTSQERLKLKQEHVLPLRGLEFPEINPTSQGVDYSAGKLFLMTARRHNPNFKLDNADFNNLVHICHMVEGMPLALELAAKWTDILPLSEVAVEIERSYKFLAENFRDLPSRHRSVRAVMDGTWKRLDETGQNLFSQLSIFRNGFSRVAAGEIIGATIKNLSDLVDKSLLNYNRSQDRYYIHELLRQFGEEKLAVLGQDIGDLLNRHSEYYCQWLANQISPGALISSSQKAVLDAIALELENVLSAWSWGIENKKYQRLLIGVEAFGKFFKWRGGPLEGERTFRFFIERLSQIDGSINTEIILLKACLLNWQADFLIDLGEAAKGKRLLEKSQLLLSSPLLRSKDTRDAQLHNLMGLAFLAKNESREIQRELQAQVITMYRENVSPFGLPRALAMGGRAAIIAGRIDEADRFLHQSFELYQDVGNQIGQCRSLIGLGFVSMAQNNYVEAERYIQQAVKIANSLDDPSRFIKTQLYLGPVYTYSGRFKQAQQVLDRCVLAFSELAYPLHSAISLFYLGYVQLHFGKFNQARACGEEAIKLIKPYDEINGESLLLPDATSYLLSGGALMAQRNYREALRIFDKAADSLAAKGPEVRIFGEGCIQLCRGAALLKLGRDDEARSIFSALLDRAFSIRRLDILLHGLIGFSLLFAQQGEIDLAGKVYSLAASHPFVGNSRWFANISGHFFEKVAPEISLDDEMDLNSSGDQPDLWAAADRLLLHRL